MKGRLRAWWPAAAWVAVIATATSWPAPRIGFTPTTSLDKVAHFALYLGLGWFVGRGLWLSDRSSLPALAVAFAAAAAFAALDEWHQRLLVGRHPSAADWLMDVAGLSFGLVLYLWPRLGSDASEGGT